ncbi:MAG: crossover junction endodeoxyribonuclease RuvC [Desulfovibrionaceae bacterium]
MDLVVLGLDPGSRHTGFGLVRESSGRAELLEAGVINAPAKRPMPERLGLIFRGVAALVEKYRPAEAAIESVFVSKSVSSALKLGQARGAALAACALGGLDVAEYAPTLVKKSVVGAGRAEKAQVAFMMARILGVKNPAWAEDASDALAVAVCHLNQRRMRKLAGL